MDNKVINLNYVWTMRAFRMCTISLNNKITLNMKINTSNKHKTSQINKKMVVEGVVLHKVGIFGICKIIKKIINKIADMVDGNKGIQVRSAREIRIKAPLKAVPIISNSTSAGSTKAKAQWLRANPRPLILIHTTGQDPCSQIIKNSTPTVKRSRPSALQERLSDSSVSQEADNMIAMDIVVRHLCGLEGTRINDMIRMRIGMTKRKGQRG